MNKTRSLMIKILAVLFLIALAAVMCVIGRGHTVYFDNKTLGIYAENAQEGDEPLVSYPAFQKVEVYVNGERVAKLSKRDRGSATCMGQKFDFSIIVTREKGGEEENHDISIALPYSLDGIVFNIPGYLACLDGENITESQYLTEFVSLATTVEEEEEEIVTDEFSLGDI